MRQMYTICLMRGNVSEPPCCQPAEQLSGAVHLCAPFNTTEFPISQEIIVYGPPSLVLGTLQRLTQFVGHVCLEIVRPASW